MDDLIRELRRINLGRRSSRHPCEVHAANAVRVRDQTLIVLDLTVSGQGEPITAWWLTRPEDHPPVMREPTNFAGLVSLMLDEQVDTGRIRNKEPYMHLRDGRWWISLDRQPHSLLG